MFVCIIQFFFFTDGRLIMEKKISVTPNITKFQVSELLEISKTTLFGIIIYQI